MSAMGLNEPVANVVNRISLRCAELSQLGLSLFLGYQLAVFQAAGLTHKGLQEKN
jgi:hypothetical protein